jgi:hypothetical protein
MNKNLFKQISIFIRALKRISYGSKASLKVQRSNIETTGHRNLHFICTQAIGKPSERKKETIAF